MWPRSPPATPGSTSRACSRHPPITYRLARAECLAADSRGTNRTPLIDWAAGFRIVLGRQRIGGILRVSHTLLQKGGLPWRRVRLPRCASHQRCRSLSSSSQGWPPAYPRGGLMCSCEHALPQSGPRALCARTTHLSISKDSPPRDRGVFLREHRTSRPTQTGGSVM